MNNRLGIAPAWSADDTDFPSYATHTGGMRVNVPDKASGDAESEAIADAVSEALSQPTGAEKDRGIFERSIAVRRAEKAKQQAIVVTALGQIRQLTASIQAMEAALDGLLISEVS